MKKVLQARILEATRLIKLSNIRDAAALLKQPAVATPVAGAKLGSGGFLSCSYTDASGSRNYKLYVPGNCSSAPLPLIVMLHGCTQSADDFALGTGMNAIAQTHGVLVRLSNPINVGESLQMLELVRATRSATRPRRTGARRRDDPADRA